MSEDTDPFRDATYLVDVIREAVGIGTKLETVLDIIAAGMYRLMDSIFRQLTRFISCGGQAGYLYCDHTDGARNPA